MYQSPSFSIRSIHENWKRWGKKGPKTQNNTSLLVGLLSITLEFTSQFTRLFMKKKRKKEKMGKEWKLKEAIDRAKSGANRLE